MNRQPKRPRGYTLVELVIVVLILGILAAAGAPKFVNALNYHRADAAARGIVLAIHTVRSAARTASTQKSIAFNVADNSFTITGVANPDHPTQVNKVKLSGNTYRTKLTSANLGGDGTLIVNGFGIPDSGGTIVVATGNQSRTIIVDQDMGTATIQ